MGIKINANFYTVAQTPTLKTFDRIREADPERYLFSKGRYKTKIRTEDLPEYFIEGVYYRTHGFMSAKGVKQVVYHPNMWVNHMFKDDYLYVSYDKEIETIKTKMGYIDFKNHDYVIRGWSIINFLKGIEKYSNYDISFIKEQIELKRKTFEENHPEFYKLEVSNPNFFD